MLRRTRLLLLVLFAVLVPACWSLAADEEPDPCATGYGGDDGFGGEGGGGFGGGDFGTGVGGSDVGTGIGGSDVGTGPSSSDVGVGAGAGPSSSDVSVGAGGGFGARPVPRRQVGAGGARARSMLRRLMRRPHRRDGIGTAQEALCPGLPPMWAAKVPPLVPLTTARLRQIAAAQGIGAGLTGIQLNRAYGLAFENWVLTMMNQLPRWTKPIPSPARQQKNMANGGLPGSVIPEQVTTVALVNFVTSQASVYPVSGFWEVKAVTGTITLSTSRWQILGLIDVAAISSAAIATDPHAPPPEVVFTITGSTTIGADVVATATQRGVAIWVQAVFEDVTIPNDPNPDLYIGPRGALNESVYNGAIVGVVDGTGVGSKLTSPKTPPMPVQNDPDPPEVD